MQEYDASLAVESDSDLLSPRGKERAGTPQVRCRVSREHLQRLLPKNCKTKVWIPALTELYVPNLTVFLCT